MQNKPTIVLIHGLLMSPKSWSGWKARYEAAGYEVIAQPWPGVSDDVEGLRKNPTPCLLYTLTLPTILLV